MCSEAGSGRSSRRGVDSEGGYYGVDVLPLEGEIRRSGSGSGPADQTTRDENTRLKQLVSELTLDKTMRSVQR